jgi:hypothetical protein
MLSYDPNKVPELDIAACAEAQEIGLHPINIICDEPNAKEGDNTGVSFIAFVNDIPRIGERIKLEDNKTCEVKRVYYKLAHIPLRKVVVLVPNIYAIRIGY